MVTLLLAWGCGPIGDWRLRRQVAEEQTRGEALLAQIPLPRVSGHGEPSQPGLVIAVGMDGVHVLDAGWAGALTPEPLRVLVPRGASLVWERVIPTPEPVGSPLLDALRERLSERAALRKSADAMSGEYTWRGAFELHADPGVPYGAVARVLYTAGQAEWSEAGLRVQGAAGIAAYVHALPGYGDPNWEGAKCLQLTLLQDREGLRARVDAGGGTLILYGGVLDGEPERAMVSLADVGALKVWLAEQGGPICEQAMLAPDSRVAWGETVALFAALVDEVGVTRPCLGWADGGGDGG